jgi:hypothetical protein
MDFEVGTLKRGGRKRPSSQPLSFVDMNQEMALICSQISLYIIACYRFNILKCTRIFICPRPPLEEIQSRINVVIYCKIFKERKRQLSRFAKNLYKDFIDIFNRVSKEDDCVELIYHALSLMDNSKKFQFSRKASIVFPLLH